MRRKYRKKSSGLYHRHLVNGMDAIIPTSLNETKVIKHGGRGATIQELRYGGLRLRLGAFARKQLWCRQRRGTF